MAKTILESKFMEWKGLDRISQIVHDMKCIWREISKDDTGIDGEIEIVVPKLEGKGFETMGNIVKVQAKSGVSYVVQDTPSSFATPVRKEDLELWANANYPVLFIVFHPKDDKLYCKEIRAYVRSTVSVFQPPLRVVFSKETDEFSPRYFDAVRMHAKVSQPRVSVQQQERLFSNLLPVRRAPSLTHASTTYKTTDDVREELKKSKQGGDWPPFCVVGDRLYTFGNLRYEGCPLRPYCDNDAESLTWEEWLESDPDRQNDYVFMLNQLLGKLCRQRGLRYNKDFDRTYFPRANDTDTTFRRDWFSIRSNQKAPARIVAKYYEYGFHKFWRHLACHLSFVYVNHVWFLRIIPKYFFTTDGLTPWDSALVGSYTTTIKAREYNSHVLNHVLFWADTLAHSRDSISYSLDGRLILSIDRAPMAGIAGFAIVDDPATFEEKTQPEPPTLFGPSLELFGDAQETDDD